MNYIGSKKQNSYILEPQGVFIFVGNQMKVILKIHFLDCIRSGIEIPPCRMCTVTRYCTGAGSAVL